VDQLSGGGPGQLIYDDKYGLDAWDQRHASRCFVTIANSAMWEAVTGEVLPNEPPTAKQYTEAGLPWFEYYAGDAEVLEGAEKFIGVKSVTAVGKAMGEMPLPENGSIEIGQVISLGSEHSDQVREVSF